MVNANDLKSIKLSLISINLNNSNGLELTIRSIIEQTFKEYELIVIDGLSNDGSIEVIKKYSDKIAYWVSEHDYGIYNAMNKGIKRAKGEYCFFINSGDFLVNNFVLEKVFKTKSSESIIIGNIIMIRDEPVRIEKYPTLSFGLFYTGSICHQATFIKRTLFEKYGFYEENLRIVSDWKFFLKTIVLNNESVKYFDTDIAYHDLYGISVTNNELFIKERRKVMEELFPRIVLEEYENNWLDIKQMKRLKRYKLTKMLVWFCDRCLNKLERIAFKKKTTDLNSIYKTRLSELNY